MGEIEGVQIKNFGPLRDVVMGKTLNNQQGSALAQMPEVAIFVVLDNDKRECVKFQNTLDTYIDRQKSVKTVETPS